MPTIDLAEFVTLEGIPLLETGVAYPASTGPFTPTSEMLAEVVLSQSDPHVPPPRIKIAHADNPLNAELQELWEELNKDLDPAAMPSLGTILNMSVGDSGQTLYGDLHGLPAWLAAILETAYPARSIEGGAWRNEANDKDYAFCLQALSLLGVVWPGCTSLADLQELFSKDGPKVSVINMPKPGKTKMEVNPKVPVVAQTNVEDIRRAFYDDFAQGDRYWWWDREVLINPAEMIVQDPDEGQLYRLPITLSDGDGVDSVTFGEPKPVKIKYVPDSKPASGSETKAAAQLIAPQLEGAGMVLAVNNTPPRSSERRKETHMALTPQAIQSLRESKGLTAEQLPDEPTEEQISDAILAPVPGTSPDPSQTPPVPATPEPGTPASGTPQPAGTPEGGVPGAANEPTPGLPQASTVDAATLAQLQADAAAGRAARQEQVNAERTAFVNAAVTAGKFARTVAPSYLTQLQAGGAVEKATRELIESLQPGVAVPVAEIGTGGDATEASTGYIDTHLSSIERERIAAAQAGSQPRERIITEA